MTVHTGCEPRILLHIPKNNASIAQNNAREQDRDPEKKKSVCVYANGKKSKKNEAA